VSRLKIDRLFVRDELGRLAVRRANVWSSTADACLDCGTTERKHEAFGRCRPCYLKWKRKTDPEWRARKNHLHKLSTIKNADRVEAREKARSKDPKRIAQRKAISKRWAQKQSPWPIGSTVWHELTPGNWIKGIVTDQKTNGGSVIQFSTGAWFVPYRQLRKEQPYAVMEVA
jgi:hypothetical protein